MVPLIGLLAVVSACSSRRTLTPATAKTLLQEYFNKQDTTVMKGDEVLVDYSAFNEKVSQVPGCPDCSNPLYQTPLLGFRMLSHRASIFQRLIKAGLMTPDNTLSPNFNKFVVQPYKLAKSGRLVVDSVDNLLLETVVQAKAQYKFHVDLNDLGKAIYAPEFPPSGENGTTSRTASVAFRKQPDGNWVCTNAEFY
jgi:hypothetical protein